MGFKSFFNFIHRKDKFLNQLNTLKNSQRFKYNVDISVKTSICFLIILILSENFEIVY